jgi:hypothetical protein
VVIGEVTFVCVGVCVVTGPRVVVIGACVVIGARVVVVVCVVFLFCAKLDFNKATYSSEPQ